MPFFSLIMLRPSPIHVEVFPRIVFLGSPGLLSASSSLLSTTLQRKTPGTERRVSSVARVLGSVGLAGTKSNRCRVHVDSLASITSQCAGRKRGPPISGEKRRYRDSGEEARPAQPLMTVHRRAAATKATRMAAVAEELRGPQCC